MRREQWAGTGVFKIIINSAKQHRIENIEDWHLVNQIKMTSTTRKGARSMYGMGVAAGMEFGDSDDDFMFADDDIEDEIQLPRVSALASNESERKIEARGSPWNKTTIAPVNGNSDHDVQRSGKTQNFEAIEGLTVEDDDVRVAILNGDFDYIANALDSGFQVKRKIKSGWTGLMFAANSAQAEVVKIFIEHGGDVNFQKDLFTPLMALCNTSSKQKESVLQTAKYLTEAGAKVNSHDRHLVTPLMFAAQNGMVDVVELLIENKAEVNAQDNRGWTALAFAANSGNTNAVKALLKNNANRTLCAYDGQTPADLAYSKGFTSLAATLDSSDFRSKGNEDSLPTARYKKLEELEMFLFGLDLGNLIELFQEHQITFQDFLKITKEELKQIGVHQLGARKKILEAIRGVHTNEWDLSGLTVDKNSKIRTIEAAAIIANVSKHLSCIQSSVLYLHQYIRDSKDAIKQDEKLTQKALVTQCNDAFNESTKLQNDLRGLQMFVTQELRHAFQEQCNFIDEKKSEKNSSKSRNRVTPIICLSLCGFLSLVSYKYVKRIFLSNT